MNVSTYINFGGNCREALDYYTKHLGAKVQTVMTYSQMPGGRPEGAPEMSPNAIMHAAFRLGETLLMAADAPQYDPMRSVYLMLDPGSIPDSERVFAALADGGEVFMPLTETFFAHRFGRLRDRFGVNWMLGHLKAPQ